MVRFTVYVQGRVRWLRVRFEFTTIQVKSNVKKIDNFFVRFDCDFKFVLGENFANFFLNSLCLLVTCSGYLACTKFKNNILFEISDGQLQRIYNGML